MLYALYSMPVARNTTLLTSPSLTLSTLTPRILINKYYLERPQVVLQVLRISGGKMVENRFFRHDEWTGITAKSLAHGYR